MLHLQLDLIHVHAEARQHKVGGKVLREAEAEEGAQHVAKQADGEADPDAEKRSSEEVEDEGARNAPRLQEQEIAHLKKEQREVMCLQVHLHDLGEFLRLLEGDWETNLTQVWQLLLNIVEYSDLERQPDSEDHGHIFKAVHEVSLSKRARWKSFPLFIFYFLLLSESE